MNDTASINNASHYNMYTLNDGLFHSLNQSDTVI